MEKPLTILLFGRPGAGKSSQFSLLEEHLRTVDDRPVLPVQWSRLRDAFMQGDSHAQARIREHHGAGKLQPKFLSVSLWGPELLNSVTGEEHVVIDGIPRHGLEAELLDSFFEFYDREPVHVVHIQVPEGVASERLRARCEAQDDPQAIANRLAWYQTDTHPLLDFFEQSPRYRVITVDATKDREAILAEIAAQLRTA